MKLEEIVNGLLKNAISFGPKSEDGRLFWTVKASRELARMQLQSTRARPLIASTGLSRVLYSTKAWN